MKIFRIVMFAFAVIFTASLITGCGNSKKDIKIEKATDVNGKEYTSAYVCPMHCKGSGSDKMGKCPACKMDYVANKNKADGDGHDHDHDHDHDHGDHSH